MTENQTPLSGPDLKDGITASTIAEGATLLGHADGEPVVMIRSGGRLFAVGAKCPHYGGPLNEGLVVDGTIRCPWHHAAFDLKTGEMLRSPALNGVACWEVEERDGQATVTARRDPPANRQRSAAVGGGKPHRPESVLIVGGGAAGAVAAESLRRQGYDGPVTIVDGGSSPPVDRPNLSKDYLAGTAPEEWIPLRTGGFYESLGIDLILGCRAASVDAHRREVSFDDGSTRPFGALLLATGADPVRLTVPDSGHRIHYLRTLTDSRSIIDAAKQSKRAVVLGASFIGLEVAASLRARGLEVTVVAPDARPLERVFGKEVGDWVRALHESHGVVFRLGRTAAAVGSKDVTLDNGERLVSDLVVAGIGVRPATALAESSGIATDRGIVVDEFLETSVREVYAAGDVARWPDPHSGQSIRVEHWVVAERQGQIAAGNILAGHDGARRPFDAVPFFWSQHYDVTIAYTGHAERWDSIEIDGDLNANDCAVSYLDAGRLLARATVFRDRISLETELAMERQLRSNNPPTPVAS